MHRGSGKQRERGTSTLEFIVVAPTLLVVLFGIMEVSRAWLAVNIATTAAREGARVGVVTPAPGGAFNPGPALAKINQILAAANLTGMITPGQPPTVTCPTPCVSDSTVTATVNLTFNTFEPLFLPPQLTGLNINRTTVMRYE